MRRRTGGSKATGSWSIRALAGIATLTAVILLPVTPAFADAQAGTRVQAGGQVAVRANAGLARAAPCGPSFTDQITEQPWPLRRLRPDRVWPVTKGRGVVVAVIDSGVSDEHQSLEGQVLTGIDLVARGDGKCDSVGHGTLIAGVIAGKEVPRSEFHGIAPEAKILPVRVLASSGREFDPGYTVRIAEAIRMATQRGAKVINLSLTTAPSPELAAAVRFALDNDVVVVAAAGNKDAVRDRDGYPAAYEGVIAVASVGRDGSHMESSVVRQYVDLAAPGENIVGPAPRGGGFAMYEEGTSFATAYVSGVAALVRAYRRDLRADDVAKRIVRTTDRTAGRWDPFVGTGVVNPYWAVLSATGEDEEPQPPSGVKLSAPEPDPLRGVRLAAIGAAVVAIAVSGILVGGVSVWQRGRRRGWKPGRPDDEI